MNITLTKQYDVIEELLGQEYNMLISDEKKNGKIELKKVGTNDSLGYVNYDNDILNGECKLFDNNGKVIRECVFKNGYISGWGREYEHGKLIFEGYYEKNRRKKQIVKYNTTSEFYKEIEDGEIKYICQYNENHEKVGKGYICENGYITKCVEFNNDNDKDQEMKIYFEIENGKMTEKDDNGEEIYKGTFSGSISSGLFRMKGQELKNNKTIYDGDWYNNKRNGKGTLIMNDDLVYDGNWIDNLPHGKGVLKKNNQVIYDGEWTNGYFIPNKNTLKSPIKYDGTNCLVDKHNNIIYEGGLEDNVPHGNGKCILEDNTIIEGKWEDGVYDNDGKEIEIDSDGNAYMREVNHSSVFSCCKKWKVKEISLRPLQIRENIENGSSSQNLGELPKLELIKQATIDKSVLFGMITFDTRLWNVEELIIKEIYLSSFSSSIEISEYCTLKSIVFRGTAFKEFQKLEFLKIHQNKHLKNIIFEESSKKDKNITISKVELSG